MTSAARPLIVGAGPVGLGAALFLARQGRMARVIDMRTAPAPQSKALAVNPRTLRLLENTGVTQRMLELGAPIRGVQFHRRGSVAAALDFAGIHRQYPFMLALSQASTEALLAEALRAAGGAAERGVRLTKCHSVPGGVEVELLPSGQTSPETQQVPWLLAADGTHSDVRQQLGVDALGSALAHEWHLADVPLRTTLSADCAHVYFLEDGAFYFMIRVVHGDDRDRQGSPVWRVMGNRPEPLTRLVESDVAGPPLWISSFRVWHRLNTVFGTRDVYFAGDAAHEHSPLGARGMNLGLEDAFVFARLAMQDQLFRYERLRRPVDRQVVRRVKLLSQMAAAESLFARLVRSFIFLRATRIGFIRSRMLATLAGLDHELPGAIEGASD